MDKRKERRDESQAQDVRQMCKRSGKSKTEEKWSHLNRGRDKTRRDFLEVFLEAFEGFKEKEKREKDEEKS